MRDYYEVLRELQHLDGRRVTLYDLLFAATHHMYHPGPKPDVPAAQRRLAQASKRLAEVEGWAANPATAAKAYAQFQARLRAEYERYLTIRAPQMRRYRRLISRVTQVGLPRNIPPALRQKVLSDLNKHLSVVTPDEPLELSLADFTSEQLQAAKEEVEAATRDLESLKRELKDWRARMRDYNRRIYSLRRRREAIGRTQA